MSKKFMGGPPITCCMVCGVNEVDDGCYYPAVLGGEKKIINGVKEVTGGLKCSVPCCQDCLDKRNEPKK